MEESVIYSTFLEEYSTQGWNKETVEYLIKHRQKMLMYARRYISRYNPMQASSLADEVYQETLKYAYNTSDYDLEKACNTISGEIKTIDGYVRGLLFQKARQVACKTAERNRLCMSENIRNSDDDTVSIFDTMSNISTLPNERDIGMELDFSRVCMNNEFIRHRYPIDLYSLIYFKLTLDKNISDVKIRNAAYECYLEVNGCSYNNFKYFCNNKGREELHEFLVALTHVEIDTALNVLKHYIPEHEHIDLVVKEINNKLLVSA